jgi:hypothetical protein
MHYCCTSSFLNDDTTPRDLGPFSLRHNWVQGPTFPWVLTGFSGTAEQVDGQGLGQLDLAASVAWPFRFVSTELVSPFVNGVTSREILLCNVPSGNYWSLASASNFAICRRDSPQGRDLRVSYYYEKLSVRNPPVSDSSTNSDDDCWPRG